MHIDEFRWGWVTGVANLQHPPSEFKKKIKNVMITETKKRENELYIFLVFS